MKTLMTLACAVLISAFSVNAQDSAALENEAKQKTEKLAKALDLTEEQHTLVYRQNYELAMNASRLKGMEATNEEKEEMSKAYMKRYNEAMKGILDDKQFAKLKEIQSEKKDTARERMK